MTYRYNYVDDYSSEHCANNEGHSTAVVGVVGHKTTGVVPNVAIGCSRVVDKHGAGAYSGVMEAVFHAAEFEKEQKRPIVITIAFGWPKSYISTRVMQEANMRFSLSLPVMKVNMLD